jgi:hypothetical protein
MPQIGGKPKKTSSGTKRHFTVVMGNKEHGLYVSSSPSSAAKKAVTKLCAANKGKKVEFHIREITQGSKKKTYGPYSGYIEKLKEPIKLQSRVIEHKSVAKLIKNTGKKMKGGENRNEVVGYSFSNLSNKNGKISSNAQKKGSLILQKNVNEAKKKYYTAKQVSNEAEKKLEEIKQKAQGSKEQAEINKQEANRLKKVANELKQKANTSKKTFNEFKQKYPNIKIPENTAAANPEANTATNPAANATKVNAAANVK